MSIGYTNPLDWIPSHLPRRTDMDDDNTLLPRDDWQTQARGTLQDEYEIYVANAESLGWPIKTFDEWLNS